MKRGKIQTYSTFTDLWQKSRSTNIYRIKSIWEKEEHTDVYSLVRKGEENVQLVETVGVWVRDKKITTSNYRALWEEKGEMELLTTQKAVW